MLFCLMLRCRPSTRSPTLQRRGHVFTPSLSCHRRRKATFVPATCSLILPIDSFAVLAGVSFSAAAGCWAGVNTRLGRAISGPVSALLVAWTLHCTGVLPEPGPCFSTIQNFVVAVSTPLLLLSADLRSIVVRARRMSLAFFLGSVGTTLGALLAFALVGPTLNTLGDSGQAWKLAAALLAKNVGSGLNFVAVASALSIQPTLLAAGLVVDNIMGLLYFPLCSWIGRGSSKVAATDEALPSAVVPVQSRTEETLAAITISFVLAACSQRLNAQFALPIATALAVLLATAFPDALKRIAPAGEAAAQPLLFMFFACAGAMAGDPRAALAYSPWLCFDLILYSVHLAVILGVGRLVGLSLPERLLASNANVGGVGTVAALADSIGASAALRSSGVLAACLGNAVATFLGLAVGNGVFRNMV